MDKTTLELISLLNEKRLRLGWSVAEIARRSRLSQPTVHRILSGQTDASFEKMIRLASCLGIEVHFKSINGLLFAIKSALTEAEDILRQTQATSQLENQGLSTQDLEDIKYETALHILREKK